MGLFNWAAIHSGMLICSCLRVLPSLAEPCGALRNFRKLKLRKLKQQELPSQLMQSMIRGMSIGTRTYARGNEHGAASTKK